MRNTDDTSSSRVCSLDGPAGEAGETESQDETSADGDADSGRWISAKNSWADGFLGAGENRSEPPESKTVLDGLSGRPTGVYSQAPEGQKTNFC